MHALVTTVRRRRRDLAVLRSIGFTGRQSRLAIAWQSTIFAVAGIVIGVPIGILTARLVWRSLADNFPLVYVPPIALAAVLLIGPAALAIVNALAAGPARAALRARPRRHSARNERPRPSGYEPDLGVRAGVLASSKTLVSALSGSVQRAPMHSDRAALAPVRLTQV
jgi:predicted lysophospholipase L1 biosynthesis ABC-type transport system permease subunit